VLLGALILTRPEYQAITLLLALVIGVRIWRGRGLRAGIASGLIVVVAAGLVVAPWMIRNRIVLDKWVPVSTGGGKALFVATYLPGGGRQVPTKRVLMKEYLGAKEPISEAELKAQSMTPLLNRVARKYPELPRDEALGRIGKENLRKYATGEPLAYAEMTVTKLRNMWERGSSPAMASTGMIAYHLLLLALAIAGSVVMALRRDGRFAAALLATPILGISVLGALLLAVPRRQVPLIRWSRCSRRSPSSPRSAGCATGPPEPRLSCRAPMELSALRILGLVLAAGLVGFALWRRGALRNGDVLLLFTAALVLVVVSATNLLDAVLGLFSFERGGGGRILGLAVFAIVVLFLLTVRSLLQGGRIERKLSATLEGIAWEEFRAAGLPERFRDRVAVVIPAYNEEDNIGAVLPRIPPSVCGVGTAVLVVDDGSRDRTGDIAREHGAAVARHVTNLGGGAALRTGYRLMSDSGAKVVVTLDADGQHLPEEMSRLVQPVLDGEVDVAHGSRVLGQAEPNHFAREMGIIFFNRFVSLITRTR
jgi:hypothetical protein